MSVFECMCVSVCAGTLKRHGLELAKYLQRKTKGVTGNKSNRFYQKSILKDPFSRKLWVGFFVQDYNLLVWDLASI